MYGLSSSGKEAIGIAVEKMFDVLAYNLLGNIPKLREKSPFFSSNPKFSLANIFIQALGNKEPNIFEKEVLKGILNSSHKFIESVKNKTSSNIMESIDAAVKESKIQNNRLSTSKIAEIIAEEMLKAKNHLKIIAEAEATKARNMGYTMEIANKAKNAGIEDPSCFFVIVRDGEACKECVRLHMMDDNITPRVWKMSELSMGYHKRGEDRPSACGEHPLCRCSLTMLPPGWGFKNGFVSFISLDYDEYAVQRGLT